MGRERQLRETGQVPGGRTGALRPAEAGSPPLVRATDAWGDVHEDPSKDALFVFMQGLDGAGSSFFAERLEANREGEWVRVTRKDARSYELDGSNHLHHRGSMKSVHDLVVRWAFDQYPAEDED